MPMRRAASPTTPAKAHSRRVSYGELRQRALGLLHHLQQLGREPGDKLILLLNNNEQFIDAFWAAVLGGIVPVPVAIGISDEHRHKLLRIAAQAGHALHLHRPQDAGARRPVRRAERRCRCRREPSRRCARAPSWPRI